MAGVARPGREVFAQTGSGVDAKTGSARHPKRRFVATTDSHHPHPIAPNVLERRFAPEQHAGINRAWAGDITYIPTAQGFLYLAVVLDLKSRRLVGWSMKETLETSLVSDALDMAVKSRLAGAELDLVFHSDRGSQYVSQIYRAQLENHGLTPSMSRKANCWDNAVLESFFATLKKEEIHRQNYPDTQSARRSVFGYIELFYNPKRRHSALQGQSPCEGN